MSEEPEEILGSSSPSTADEELEKGLVAAMIGQPKLLDELAKQMVTLCLAIPGLFATVLKLTGGDEAVLPVSCLVFWAFGCWLVALLLSLASLVPVTRKVDRQVVRRAQPATKGQSLSIEEFFTQSAKYKRRLLVAAALLCFAGIALAAASVFGAR
ncbi:MAG: hypothetical protein HGB06_03460 [Chlorobaculum sp.]|jgi:hypothetical protein|nr:hypothetical protein [Chlorobaculum sp.]